MGVAIRCTAICLWLAACVSAFAQQDPPAPRTLPEVPGTLPEVPGTLPEVVVEPQQEAAPLPSVTVEPETTDNAPSEPPSDAPFPGYPGLDEMILPDFGGSLRSERSIFDDPRHITVVGAQELTRRAPTNMIEALQHEVGVLMQSTGSGQASPFVRGLTGPQTLILIDGIRLNNSTFRFGPNQYFGTIDPSTIERIEVVRGPQSVLWGSDAIGGVINVVTRSGATRFEHEYASGEMIGRFESANYTGYGRVSAESSRGELGWFGGASYLNVRDLDRGGDLGRQPFTNYSQYAGDIKFDRLLSPQDMITVALQHVEQQDVPRSDRFPDEFRVFSPQQRDLVYARWQGYRACGFFDTYTATVSAQRQKEGTIRRRPPSSTNERRAEFSVETTGINLVWSKDLDRWGKWTWGTDLYHDEVDARNHTVDVNTGAATVGVPQFPDDSYYERLGTFLEWDVPLTPRMQAVTGVRYSNIDPGATVALFDPLNLAAGPTPTPVDPSFQDWTSSVGLVYQVSPCLHLVGSYSEGFRAPGLDELTSVSDNVNEGVDLPTSELDPETSVNYEVGVKLNFSRWRGQMFYFWNDLDELIDRVLVATGVPNPLDPADPVDVFQRRNLGSAQVQGLELNGQYLLGCGWSSYGNFSYLLGSNLTDAEPLSRIPPTQGILGLRWQDECGKNWFAVYGWLVRHQDRLSGRDIRDSRIPPGGTPGYGTLNLRSGRMVGHCQRVTLTLENILDKAYRVHGSGVDGPGFNAHLGWELYY